MSQDVLQLADIIIRQNIWMCSVLAEPGPRQRPATIFRSIKFDLFDLKAFKSRN